MSSATPLTPLTMFTATYEATIENVRVTSHEALIKLLRPHGAIRALNCNFGHLAQPGYEHHLKLESKHARRLARRQNKEQKLAPTTTRQRKLQGDGTCFNSSIEVVIAPGPSDTMPEGFAEIFARKRNPYYALKFFPAHGVTQVAGVIDPDLADGRFIVSLWVQFLSAAGIGRSPEQPLRVGRTQTILTNFKCNLTAMGGRVVMNLSRLVARLEAAKTRTQLASAADMCQQARACWRVDIEAVMRRVQLEIAGPTRTTAANYVYRARRRAEGRNAEDVFDPATVVRANTGRAVDATLTKLIPAVVGEIAAVPTAPTTTGPICTEADLKRLDEVFSPTAVAERAATGLRGKVEACVRRMTGEFVDQAFGVLDRAEIKGERFPETFTAKANAAKRLVAKCQEHGRPVGDVAMLAEFASAVAQIQEAGAELAPHVQTSPFPIREIKPVQDNHNIAFKFAVGPASSVRVNVFFSGKFNILGARSPEAPHAIYAYLTRLYRDNYAELVGQVPLNDREIAEIKRLDDARAEQNRELAGLLVPAFGDNPEAAMVGFDEYLVQFLPVGELYTDLHNTGVDQVQSDDVQEYEKDTLYD